MADAQQQSSVDAGANGGIAIDIREALAQTGGSLFEINLRRSDVSSNRLVLRYLVLQWSLKMWLIFKSKKSVAAKAIDYVHMNPFDEDEVSNPSDITHG